MIIKTEELKRFLSAAADIKVNLLASYLDVIKIECTGNRIYFTKTNQNLWCQYQYECQFQKSEIFLINEKMLNGVVITTKEVEVEIMKTKKGIDIVYGEKSIKAPIIDAKTFPISKTPSGDKILLTTDTIKRIKVASKFVSKSAARTAMNFVRIGIDGIFATNGQYVYHHNTFPLPEVFFDDDPLQVLAKNTESEVYYSVGENYDFFQIGSFSYSFIKSVVKPFEYKQIVDQTGTLSFTVSKSEILDFCTMAQYSKKNQLAIGSLATSNKILNLIYSEPEASIDASQNVSIESDHKIEKFSFNIDEVAYLLKALPYNSLTFTQTTANHIALTTDEDIDYKGIIAKRQD